MWFINIKKIIPKKPSWSPSPTNKSVIIIINITNKNSSPLSQLVNKHCKERKLQWKLTELGPKAMEA